MSEQNPFEPPSDRPRSLDPLTARRLLELPDRGPPRAAFGDYAFWPIISLIGVALTVGMLFFGRLSLLGIGLVAFGFWKWFREAFEKR